MAIIFGNNSDNGTQGTNSYSHNNNGDFLFVMCQGTTAVSSITYGGVSMTQIGTNQTHTAYARTINIWGLVNPAKGSNTLSASGGVNIDIGAVSLLGVNQSNPYTGFVKKYETGTTSTSIDVTTTVDNAYCLGCYFGPYSSVGANTTNIRQVIETAFQMIRSTNTVYPLGTATINTNSTGTAGVVLEMVGINPATSQQTFGEYLPNSNTKLLLHLNGSSADSSGNNNNGTDTAITYSQANGKFGQGAGFNGSSSKIVMTDSASLSLTGNYSIGGWFKLGANPSSETIFAFITKTGAGETAGYGLDYYNNSGTYKIRAYHVSSSVFKIYSTTKTIPLNEYHHILMTYNGTTQDLYFNGVRIGGQAQTSNPSDNSENLNLGTNGPANNQWLNGAIDEVIIENTAWSAEKIKKYYSASRGRFGIL